MLGRYIQPCDPTEVDSPPDGADWIHEIKWDGYQAMTDKNAYTSFGLDNGGDDLRKPLTSPGSKW